MHHSIHALESLPHARWCGGILDDHVLHDHDLLRDGVPDGGCCWSGSLAEEGEPPLVWLSRGWDRLRDRLSGPGRCLIRPRTDHVLSDVPSTQIFLRELAGERVSLALGPASMLTPGMLRDAEDHLKRIFEALGSSTKLVLLEDLDESGRPVPLGDGVLPGGLIGSLIQTHVPGNVAVGGLADRDDHVARWLVGALGVQ